MSAYPWAREKSFSFEIAQLKKARAVTGVLLFLASVVLSPLTAIVAGVLYLRFRVKNDLPRVWSWVTMVFSVVLSLIVYLGFQITPVDGTVRLVKTFGDLSSESWSSALPGYLFTGLPLGLFFAGLFGVVACTLLDLRARRYLGKSKPTIVQEVRGKRAAKGFTSDAVNSGKMLRVGVLADDLLPWRECHRGMVVGAPFNKLKHGLMVGANGTGKTIAAMNVVTEYVDGKWSVVYPDFKGDPRTENMLAAIARERGVPFYSFWSNNTMTGFNYDPVRGSLNEAPASVLVTAFDFSTEGDGAYYTDEAEKYLALQFRVYREFAKHDPTANESVMDWLLRTMSPKVLEQEIAPAMGSKDKERVAAARALREQIKGIDPRPLSRLQANLSKVVNSIGPKMRPSNHMIELRKAVDEGAIVYFGLPSAGDKTVMRALGALIIRDLVAMTAERFQESSEGRTNVLVMPDEASQLGEKADTMLEILTQGRSAGVMIFPVMQTFAQFTDKFIRELLGNSPTSVVMRVTDVDTVIKLSEAMGSMNVREERTDTQGRDSSMGMETQEGTGARMGTITLGPRVLPDDIMDLENRHALVFFPESPGRATVRKPFLKRLRRDETKRDIPTTQIISRQFILDAEEDQSITAEVLRGALGKDFEEVDTTREAVPADNVPEAKPKYAVSDADPFDSWMSHEESGEDEKEVVAEPAEENGAGDEAPFVDEPSEELLGYSVDEEEVQKDVPAEPVTDADDFADEVQENIVDTEEPAVTEYDGKPETSESPAKLSGIPQASGKPKKDSKAEEDDLWG